MPRKRRYPKWDCVAKKARLQNRFYRQLQKGQVPGMYGVHADPTTLIFTALTQCSHYK